jgi:predicted amidophosphoribosyltransferase
VGCGKEGAGICQECHPSLPRVEQPFCSLCAQPDEGDPCLRCTDSPLHIDGIRAPYLMEGIVREVVYSLK